jgi:hypothetical protein
MTDLHSSTFGYLSPSPEQVRTMNILREAAALYANALDTHVPNGPDKTYLLRQLREVAMWANVSVTRNPDGSPRETKET